MPDDDTADAAEPVEPAEPVTKPVEPVMTGPADGDGGKNLEESQPHQEKLVRFV